MIIINFNQRDFEYDVHSLVKAFYPAEDIKIRYAEDLIIEDDRKLIAEAAKETDLLELHIEYGQQDIIINFNINGKRLYHESAVLQNADGRVEKKNILKRMLYQMLKKHTGKELPWGTLTGIRPVKLAMQRLEVGDSNVEIAEYMRQTYLMSPQKTALSVSIANREKDILKSLDYEEGYSLYIGIPFCPTICLYCSFSSYPLHAWKQKVDLYLEALCKEIEYAAEAFKKKKLNTIYIGGGTPTTLEAEQMERLLSKVEESFDFADLQEYTVEAGRPDSITADKLEVLRKYGVGRISINPQTMNESTLRLIGRRHTVEQIRESYYMARELGFDNINMDLIVGLPGEKAEDIERTLKEINKLNPDSMTVHSLALKRAARLNIDKEQYSSMEFLNSSEIMEMARQSAASMDMYPYYLYRQKNSAGNFENIGYAKVDKAGIYNILIMEEKQSIAALGAGAITKIVYPDEGRIERVDNVKDIDHYLARIDEMIERKRLFFQKHNVF